MPAKSARQFRAMAAAASGHSTLGIPQSVGREFIEHKPKGEKMFGNLISKLAQKKGFAGMSGTSKPKQKKGPSPVALAMRKMHEKRMKSKLGSAANTSPVADNNY